MNRFSRLFFVVFLIYFSCNDDEPTIPPLVTSFEPASGLAGSQVKIIGGYFGEDPQVFFNDVQAEVNAIADNQLTVTVPNSASTGKIKVTKGKASTVTADDFVVLLVPRIISFSPGAGAMFTQVTITGENFIAGTKVFFGEVAANIVELQPDKIIVEIPNGSIPSKIFVVTEAGTAESASIFVANAPVIAEIRPLYGDDILTVTSPHQTIVFEGQNLTRALDQITLTFGGVELLNVRLIGFNLAADIPAGVAEGKIAYSINGYTTTFERVIRVPPGGTWRELSSTDFMFTYGTGFKIGTYYYAGLGHFIAEHRPAGGPRNNTLFKFNSINETWTTLPNTYPSTATDNVVAFSINGKAYAGGGTGGEPDDSYNLYEFDPATESWSFKSRIPEEVIADAQVAGFTLNNKGYLVNEHSGNLYEYDATGDSWTLKSVVPGLTPITFKNSFTLDGRQYIAFSNVGAELTELWEYDATSNLWSQKADYPASLAVGAIAFDVNGKGYLGHGNYFYRYDVSADSWTELPPYPTAQDIMTSFSFGSKGYAGLPAKPFQFDIPVDNKFYAFDIQ